MAQPTRTPNPATTDRPQRSSTRVARKRPLGWLPWALLGLLLLLLALILLGVRAARDDDGNADGTPRAAVPTAGTGATGPGAGGTGGSGGTGGTGATGGAGGTGLASGALAGLGAGALTGGGGVSAAADAKAAAALLGPRDPGTAGTVLFDEGSASLDGDAQKVVATAAQNLRTAGAKNVEVVGYTDKVAGAPVNEPLSQERADAVAAALRTELPGVTVTTSAQGQEQPIATNDTAEGRQQNRRAAILARG